MIRRAMVLAILLGAAATIEPAAAQRDQYIVRGVVRDTEGKLVPDVEIIMESPRRMGKTDPRGYFLLDSVPAGKHRILVRRIGYLAVNPVVMVPQLEGDTLQIVVLQMPQLLPSVDVQVDRKGIYGVVGDTGYRALPGTLVEILGARIADTTDEQGRFAFEGLPAKHYMLRVSRIGYFGRLISLDYTGKGRDFSVFLTKYEEGAFDWANSMQAAMALPDLAIRLAMEPKRYRITREELARFGTIALCDIPRIRSQVGVDPNIVVRGAIWSRNTDLCAWSADQMDLVEFGTDPCKEAWKSIAEVLGNYCGPQRQISLYGTAPGRRKGYVVIWPKG